MKSKASLWVVMFVVLTMILVGCSKATTPAQTTPPTVNSAVENNQPTSNNPPATPEQEAVTNLVNQFAKATNEWDYNTLKDVYPGSEFMTTGLAKGMNANIANFVSKAKERKVIQRVNNVDIKKLDVSPDNTKAIVNYIVAYSGEDFKGKFSNQQYSVDVTVVYIGGKWKIDQYKAEKIN